MVTDTAPLTRADLLADLQRRFDKANEYAEEAIAAGDEDKLQRAVYRVFLRSIQHSYLNRRPPDARCPDCERPGGAWTQAELLAPHAGEPSVPPLWMCIQTGDARDHSFDALDREARSQLDIWLGAAPHAGEPPGEEGS